jgi:TolB-like protein
MSKIHPYGFVTEKGARTMKYNNRRMCIITIISAIVVAFSGCASNTVRMQSNGASGQKYIIDREREVDRQKVSVLDVSEKIAEEIVADLRRGREHERTYHFAMENRLDGSEPPMAIMTVTDANYLQTTVDFGRALTECLITSFEQQGFRIIEIRKTNEVHLEKRNGEYYLSRDLKEIKKSVPFSRVLVGTYSVAYDTVILNTRLIDAVTGKILGSSAKEISIDENVRSLLTNGGSLSEMADRIHLATDGAHFREVGITAFERQPSN